MSKNFMKKTLAGIFALVIVASSTPIAPFVSVMNSNSITASAETASETDFDFDASSGTITKYTGTGGDVEIPSKIGGVAVTSIGDWAFLSCSSLASVTIPEGVTSIGDHAFLSCSNLASVTIPEGVTSIGVGAFAYCSKLASVTIPEGVTSIGVSAFSGCSSLASVIIPEGVTSIGDYAFMSCSNLASVTIPEGVTSIGDGAFEDCWDLTSVTIPEGVTKIGEYAFGYCSNLASVTIPEGVTSIGVSAFSGCSSLTSITAPCTLKNSMSDAMGDCLAEITYTHPGANREEGTYKVKCAYCEEEIDYTAIFTLLADEEDFLSNVNPDDYTEDSWKALDDSATALEKIVNDFQENKFVSSQDVLTAALSAYNDAKDALELKEAENFEFDASSGTITKYTGTGGDVEIPSKIGGVAVTSIGESVFKSCLNLTSVTIPEGVTSIGDYAFMSCSNLTSVTIPEGVTSIGVSAFSGCSSLTSITTPCTLKNSMSDAMGDCPAEITYTHPGANREEGTYKVKCACGEGEIDYTAIFTLLANEEDFLNNVNPEDYTEDSWKALDDSATALAEIVSDFQENKFVSSQDDLTVALSAYNDAKDALVLKDAENFEFDASSGTITKYTGTGGDVEIPSKIGGVAVTSIGVGAFESCQSLTSVTIPEGVTSIGGFAFQDCPSLAIVTIPEGVTSIGECAFFGCEGLVSVTIPEGVTSIGMGAFAYCSKLASVTIPEGVTSIGDSAFEECYDLTSVTIPEGVTSIGDYAFSGCSSLTSVTIPEGVTSIGNCAFQYCYRLTSVTIPEGVTSIGAWAFSGCQSLASVTIPEGVTSIGTRAFSGCQSLASITAPCTLKNSMSGAMDDCQAEITYTHPGANREEGTYKVKCAYCEEEIDYTAIFELLADEDDFLSNVNPDDYTEDSWKALKDSAAALAEIVSDFQENKFVSSQDELTAALSAYNDAREAPNFEFDASSGTITKYTGTGGDVEIPSKIGGVAVTSIGGFAFQDCQSLVSVTIPEGVTSIGVCAFVSCLNLASVTIPEGVTSIGMGAFAYCSKLASVTIPEGVTSIGDIAFEECYDLTSVTIPEGVTSIGARAFSGCQSLASITAPCTLKNSMSGAMDDCQAEITYTHPGANREEGTYKVKCAYCEEEIDYTAIFTLLADEEDFLSNVNPDDYTEDSWKALDDSATALAEIVSDFQENKFVSSQDELTAALSAYNGAKDALEEKPQYDTLYECYLVTAPTVTEMGTYNKRAYHYENDAKVVDTEKVFAEDKAVTFEQWYLRTLIQYQTNGTEFDLRFVSMLDENLDQYQKAGFIFTINGTEVSDELSTVTANTSYIVDGSKVDISAFSQPDDYFFLQKYVFDIGEIDLDATMAVTAYVVLADGTELQGTKAVTFTLRQFEG